MWPGARQPGARAQGRLSSRARPHRAPGWARPSLGFSPEFPAPAGKGQRASDLVPRAPSWPPSQPRWKAPSSGRLREARRGPLVRAAPPAAGSGRCSAPGNRADLTSTPRLPLPRADAGPSQAALPRASGSCRGLWPGGETRGPRRLPPPEKPAAPPWKVTPPALQPHDGRLRRRRGLLGGAVVWLVGLPPAPCAARLQPGVHGGKRRPPPGFRLTWQERSGPFRLLRRFRLRGLRTRGRRGRAGGDGTAPLGGSPRAPHRPAPRGAWRRARQPRAEGLARLGVSGAAGGPRCPLGPLCPALREVEGPGLARPRVLRTRWLPRGTPVPGLRRGPRRAWLPAPWGAALSLGLRA